jgi:fibronectin-binding autotransporter adhesin
MKPKFRSLHSSVIIIALTTALTGAAAAQSGTWTSLTSGGNWSDAANWAGGVVADGAGNTANLSAVDLPEGPFAVNLLNPRTIGSLNFGDTDPETAGTWSLAGAATLTLAGTTPTVTTGVSATINNVIAGANGYSKQGSGVLTLAADNSASLTGGITVKAGTLSLITAAANLQRAIGSPSNTVTFEGGTLSLNGSGVNDNGSTVFGPFANPIVVATGQTGTLRSFPRGQTTSGITGTLTGGGTLNLVVRSTRGDLSGNWNAFTGSVIVSSGTTPTPATFADLRINGTNQFQNSRLHLNPSVYMVQVFNPPNSGTVETIQNIGKLSGDAGSILAGNPVSGRFVNWTIGSLNEDSEFAGDIANAAGAARITKTGSAELILSGNNTYTGSTTVSSGILSIGKGGATGTLGNTNATVASGATLVFNRNNSAASVYPGILAGAGDVVKRGNGRVDFTGVNTYSAGTLIQGGVIGINSASSLGVATGQVTFSDANGGILAIAPSIVSTRGFTVESGITASFGGATAADGLRLDGSIDGTGSLAINGNGIITLAGANTYGGSTTITSGTLVVDNLSGSATSTGAVSLSAGTLGGTGTIGGSVSAASGTSLKPGAVTSSSTSVGSLATGPLNLAGGATIHQEFVSAASYDKILVNGSLSTSGASSANPVLFDLRAENSIGKWTTPGTYNLIQHSGFTGNANELFKVSSSSAQAGLTYTFGNSGGFITLTISGAAPSEWNIDANGIWTNAPNWINGIPNASGAFAIFGNVITAPRTVTVDSPKSIGAIQFNNANSYSVTGTAALTFSTASGDAEIGVLAGSHSISAPLTLSKSLSLSSATAANTLTLSGAITGIGGLKNSGAGTTRITGANTFSGDIEFTAGTLSFGNGSLGTGGLLLSNSTLIWEPGNSQDISNRAISLNGTTTTFDTNGNNVSLANAIGQGGTANFVKTGAGRLTFAADPTYAGTTTISGGELQLGTGGETGSVVGNITNNGQLIVNLATGRLFNNLITGNGSLLHAGSGTLTLNAQNTHTGLTSISNGVLILGSGLSLQNSTLNLQSGGGLLSFGDLTAATIGGLSGAVNLPLQNNSEASVALTVGGNGNTTTYAGVLSGPGSLIKIGTGVLTLSGDNTYTGATTTNGGTLFIDSTGKVATTSANVGAGATLTVEGGSLTASAASTISAATFRLNGGAAAFNGGIASGTNDATLISITDGTFSSSSITLPRTQSFGDGADPTAMPTTGLAVSGGTVTAGNLTIGTSNSGSGARFSGGVSTFSGTVTVGNSSNTRWSLLVVDTSGEFISTNAETGIILSPNATTPNKSAFIVSGGAATVERIAFGAAGGAAGIGRVNVTGGELYVGAGGLVKIPANFTTQINIGSGGVLAAKDSWTSSLPINIVSGLPAYIRTANALGEPRNIGLSGPLTGPGSLTKEGAGTLTLSGGNSYAGDTRVEEGRLVLTTNTLSDEASVIVDSGAVLELGFSGGDKIEALTLADSMMPDGIYGRVGTNKPGVTESPLIEGNGLLYVGVDLPPVGGYDAWASNPANGLTAGVNDGPTQDPDNDGISNLMEFVLGGNPTVSSTAVLPKLTVTATSFVFTFNRNDDSESEAGLTFQHGTNLTTWTDVIIGADNAGSGPEVSIAENGADPDAITVTIPRGSNTRLFGRLKVVK